MRLLFHRISLTLSNKAFAAILFGELQEVNFSFWLGIALIIISVLIQTRRVTHTNTSR